MIDTKRVSDRRALRFESLDAAVRDAELLAEAERNVKLRATGNWKLGQALGHLAFWARTPFDGYPEMPRAPWFVRLLVKPFKNHLLNKKLPAGGRIPNVPGGTHGIEPMPTDDAIDWLHAAFARLERESPQVPNIALGPLTHEDWIKLNLRHAELHLSFFHAD